MAVGSACAGVDMTSVEMAANLFATIDANSFASNSRKIVCMKTKGQLVKAWREAKGLNTATLGKMAGTSRQNIENLENDEVDFPRYLPRLAKAMGYEKTDDLLALKEPPAQSPKSGHPEAGAHSDVNLAHGLSLVPFQDPPTISWERVLSGELLPPLFKLAMPDDALAPRTPRGTVYIFSTEGAPEDGDVVLVKAANGKPCMRLHFDGVGGDWEVRSRDAAHPPMQRVRDGVERLARALFRAGGQG